MTKLIDAILTIILVVSLLAFLGYNIVLLKQLNQKADYMRYKLDKIEELSLI